ncbi:hypothetical protein CLOM_g21180 [Closterium sp. NIES-68]|nr:hypothetical protein CLOM_g21180 [Closterium sp. NIES-68]GJP58846.1 hypothetical protein CLOP_g4389 [Closterium sp. NIES-67]
MLLAVAVEMCAVSPRSRAGVAGIAVAVAGGVVAAGGPSQGGSFFECDESQAAMYSATFDPSTAPSARFLAIAHLWEQLSKARLHLAEAMALARHWGRTLVLPRVSSSRIGGNNLPRGTFPACAYFDTELIGRFVPWVTEEYLWGAVVPAWEGRGGVGQGGGRGGRGWRSATVLLDDFRGQRCNLTASVLKTRRPFPASPHLPSSWNTSLYGLAFSPRSPLLCTTSCDERPWLRWLPPRAEDLRVQEEVAVLMKFTHTACLGRLKPLADLAQEHLEYAPHLHRLVSSFASHHLNQGRYIAAHWRVEKAMMSHRSPVQMQQCVEGLLRDTAVWWLQEREREAMPEEGEGEGVRGRGSVVVGVRRGGGEEGKVPVFMATDLTPENKWLSGTAHLDQRHREIAFHAVKDLYARLQPPQLDAFLPGLREADIGVQAILDKLLCINAAVFLYAPPSCRNYAPTGSGSAVADEICWWRARLGKEGRMRGSRGLSPCRMWGDGQ